MEIYISEEDIIMNIQQEFNAQYPHLKLQFYKNPHRESKASPKRELLSPRLPIEKVAAFHRAGIVDINPDRTVAELEYDFFHKVGLSVQVFRKRGDTWLQTTETDFWTLGQQEQEGRESSLPLASTETPDYNPSDDD